MGISIRGASHLTNERGQSLVEYILILFVTVALILGLMFEFGTAFQAWANNYFGDYLTCLLETGELPSIGGTPGDSGTCNQFFQPFSLKNGRPSVALGQAGSGGQSSSKPSGLNRSGARRDSRGGGSSSGPTGGKWNNAGSGGNGQAGVDAKDGEKAGGAAKTGNMNASSGSGYSSRTKVGNGDGGRQIDGRMPVGRIGKDDESKKGYSTGAQRGDGMPGVPKRVRLKQTRKPAAIAEDQPLTFGNFIRTLVIAAIIIALVVVIGGQVLQATKGMDAAD